MTTEQQEKKYKQKSKCEISNFFEEKKLLKSEAYSKKSKKSQKQLDKVSTLVRSDEI